MKWSHLTLFSVLTLAACGPDEQPAVQEVAPFQPADMIVVRVHAFQPSDIAVFYGSEADLDETNRTRAEVLSGLSFETVQPEQVRPQYQHESQKQEGWVFYQTIEGPEQGGAGLEDAYWYGYGGFGGYYNYNYYYQPNYYYYPTAFYNNYYWYYRPYFSTPYYWNNYWYYGYRW